MLRTWKLAAPPSASDLVFLPRQHGEPLRRSDIILRSGVYPCVCARRSFRRCNVKTLRHSFASGLLAQGGADPRWSQGLMGHANPGVVEGLQPLATQRQQNNGAAARYAASFPEREDERTRRVISSTNSTVFWGLLFPKAPKVRRRDQVTPTCCAFSRSIHATARMTSSTVEIC